jgi:hypothetical protein
VKYHCYIEYRESVYDSNVVADSVIEAAQKAAEEHGIGGRWAVVPGEPRYVDIVIRKSYTGTDAAGGTDG